MESQDLQVEKAPLADRVPRVSLDRLALTAPMAPKAHKALQGTVGLLGRSDLQDQLGPRDRTDQKDVWDPLGAKETLATRVYKAHLGHRESKGQEEAWAPKGHWGQLGQMGLGVTLETRDHWEELARQETVASPVQMVP